MIKIINIQSISDVITNSSSEVFIKEDTETLKQVLESLDLMDDAIYLKDEESVKNYILEDYGAYDLIDSEEFKNTNPYNDYSYLISMLEEFKSKDEIWDFFKCFYKDLIGKVVLSLDRDYLYEKEDAAKLFIDWNKLD